MYVYVIRNGATGKIYIGQHKRSNLRQYLQKKFYYARTQKQGSSYLFNAMRKYPDPEQWSIEPLLEVDTKEQLDRWERLLIALYDTRNPEVGYNICKGGEGFTGKWTQVRIDYMREKMKGRTFTAESIAKMKAAPKSEVQLRNLQHGRPSMKDMVGVTSGALTVIQRAGSNKKKQATWLCHCQCGNKVVVDGYNLRSGHTKSCGCFNANFLRKYNHEKSRRHS